MTIVNNYLIHLDVISRFSNFADRCLPFVRTVEPIRTVTS